MVEPACVALGEFPGLNSKNEYGHGANGQCPLPCDSLVLEDLCIKCRNVDNRKDGEGANDNRVEQELVGVNLGANQHF